MKISFCKTGAMALACAMSLWSAQVASAADVTISATTNMGTIEEFAPGSNVIVRSENSPDPLRYSITSSTTYVDETGTPVAVERISRGTPVTVHTVREGDRVVADRVVVRKAPATVTERRTVTTHTRPMTKDEKEAREDAREAREEAREKINEAREEAREKRAEALEELYDDIDD